MRLQIYKSHAAQNIRSVFGEFFGDKIDHPLLVRALACLIDYIILTGMSMAIYFAPGTIGIPFEPDLLVTEIFLYTTYFTLGNSKIFKGQTVGKKLLKIRVVEHTGEYLTLPMAFIRSIPNVLLFSSYAIMSYMTYNASDLIYRLSLNILMIVILAAIYFPVLSIRRQALHDYLAYSQVIPKQRSVKIEMNFNWTLFAGFGVIVVACMAVINHWV